MENLIRQIRNRAKRSSLKKIVLPEGHETRVLEAASRIVKENLAEPIILGDAGKIRREAKGLRIDLESVKIVDPGRSEKFPDYVEVFYNLRKHKGVSVDEAREMVSDNLYFAALMTREGLADGFVAGASHTTKDVARAAILCIPVDEKIGIVSSAFIMIVNDDKFGEDGVLIFSDCGIVPEPNAVQLSNIALSASGFAQDVLKIAPRVAMLSYSTKGSGKGASVERVVEATRLAKERARGILIDGELQADAAIVPDVCEIKSPSSPLKGHANVLIFPNLDSGNIAYKLVQRLAKARAVGPVMLGTTKPASDLSRGCSSEDIVDTVALVAVMARPNDGQSDFGLAGGQAK